MTRLLRLLALGIFLAIALSLAIHMLGTDRHCQVLTRTTMECRK